MTTLLAAPFSKRINQGFIAVDDPTRYTDDPVFLFIASYAVVVELNEIKQQQSLLAATKPPNTIRRTSILISLAAWRLSAPKGH